MPGPATIFSLGAVGAVAVYASRRKSTSSDSSEDTSPIALARRRSSTVATDHEWSSRLQPESMWLRNNGASFSHNSEPKYPTTQQRQPANHLQQNVAK